MGVFLRLYHENQWKNKHVESLLVSCLDQGSTPCKSTPKGTALVVPLLFPYFNLLNLRFKISTLCYKISTLCFKLFFLCFNLVTWACRTWWHRYVSTAHMGMSAYVTWVCERHWHGHVTSSNLCLVSLILYSNSLTQSNVYRLLLFRYRKSHLKVPVYGYTFAVWFKINLITN